MNEVIWKTVSQNPNYQVSNHGEIMGIKMNKILRAHQNNKGVYVVRMFSGGKPKTYSVHRIVAEAFLENVDASYQVKHIDGDKANNVVSNLKWYNPHKLE